MMLEAIPEDDDTKLRAELNNEVTNDSFFENSEKRQKENKANNIIIRDNINGDSGQE